MRSRAGLSTGRLLGDGGDGRRYTAGRAERVSSAALDGGSRRVEVFWKARIAQAGLRAGAPVQAAA